MTTFPSRCVNLLVMMSVIAASEAKAQITWTNATASTSYNTPANWSTATVPGSSTATTNIDIAQFAAAGTGATIQMNFGTLGSPFYLGTLQFTSTVTLSRTMGANTATAGVLTLNGTGANKLILDNLSGTFLMTLAPLAGGSGTGMSVNIVNANSTINTSTGGILISSNITGAGFIKTGTGTLSLTGANSYSGVTAVSTGNLSIGTTGSLPGYNTNGSYSVAGAATLAVYNAVSDADIATILATTNFASGSSIGFDTTTANRAYSVAVTDTAQGSLGLTKIGLNTLTISGTNTYTGITRVHQGTLTVTADESAANGGWFIAPQAGENTLTRIVNFNAGSTIAVAAGKTFQLGATAASGAAATVNVAGTVNNSGQLNAQRGAVLNIGSGGIWNQSGSMLVAAPAGSGVSTAMTVATGGSFIYNNPATSLIQINAASNGNGNTTLTISGTFTTNQGFTNTIATTTGTGVATLTLVGGTLALTADVPVLTATAGTTFNFTLGTGGGTINTNAFSTTMNRVIGGTAGLTKTGSGTLILGAVNMYSGTTSVNVGILSVSGSLAAGSAVTVAGGTLAGTGTVNGTVAVNLAGTLAPGTSAAIGTLAVASPVTFGTTGTGANPTLASKLGDPASPTADLLALTGTGAAGVLALQAASTLNLMPQFAVGNTAATYTVSSFASETGTFGTVLINGSAAQNTDPSLANYALVTYNPTNIQVTVANLTPVPEPGTFLGLSAVGFGLARWLRRRRSAP